MELRFFLRTTVKPNCPIWISKCYSECKIVVQTVFFGALTQYGTKNYSFTLWNLSTVLIFEQCFVLPALHIRHQASKFQSLPLFWTVPYSTFKAFCLCNIGFLLSQTRHIVRQFGIALLFAWLKTIRWDQKCFILYITEIRVLELASLISSSSID